MSISDDNLSINDNISINDDISIDDNIIEEENLEKKHQEVEEKISIVEEDEKSLEKENMIINKKIKKNKKINNTIKEETIARNLIEEINNAISKDEELLANNKIAMNKIKIADKIYKLCCNNKIIDEFIISGGLNCFNNLLKIKKKDEFPLLKIRTTIFEILLKMNIDQDLFNNHKIKNTLKIYLNSVKEINKNKENIKKILERDLTNNKKINQNYEYLKNQKDKHYNKNEKKYEFNSQIINYDKNLPIKLQRKTFNFQKRPMNKVLKNKIKKVTQIDKILKNIKTDKSI